MHNWFEDFNKDQYVQGHRWEQHEIRDGFEIHHFLNDQLKEITRIEEGMVTSAVVALLRRQGYTVIEPESKEQQ